MKKFNKFYFEKYSFDKTKLIAYFSYSFDRKEYFEEEIDFSSDFLDVKKDLDDKYLDNLLFNIHLVLGISYYKLYPTNKLVLNNGVLTKEQIVFWEKMYLNGLGEFFIKNNIIPHTLINFEVSYGRVLEKKTDIKIGEKNNGALLMWGGGKDSIVSSILLDRDSQKYTPFIFGKIDKIKKETLEVLGKRPILVKRKLSENLFKLNKQGYYNGHVPITGIIAFISLMSAYLYDYKDIVLSNERSASEGNRKWKGVYINHQYSKSGEFEEDFRNYVQNYISSDINYYSLLRDKYEYEIASIFAENASKYFDSFSSCNKNFKIEKKENLGKTNWCCKCEKCCFVYCILSPFLDKNTLISIFGEDLFENKDLLDIFKTIIGYKDYKPFECVGTYEESLFSIIKIIDNYKTKINSGENVKIPYILKELDSLIDLRRKSMDLVSLESKLINKK